MQYLTPAMMATFLLSADPVRADVSIHVDPARLTALLHQPIALVVEATDQATTCVNKRAVENRGKAAMSRYKVVRAEAWGQDNPTAIAVNLIGGETITRAGSKDGNCIVAISLQLLSGEGDGTLLVWGSDLQLLSGPGEQTGRVADSVQNFIDALVAQAAG